MNVYEYFKKKYYLFKHNSFNEYKLINDYKNIEKKYYSFNEKRIKNYAMNFNIEKEKKSIAVRDFICFFKKNVLSFLKEKTVLDIGCGLAFYYLLFKEYDKNFNYTGIEYYPELINIGKQYISPYINFKQGSAINLEFQNNSFELILFSGILHYLYDDYEKALDEAIRVSKKYILITRLPIIKFNSSKIIENTIYFKNTKESHLLKIFNKDEIEQVFYKKELTIIKQDYSSELTKLKFLDENIICNMYLLEKK